MKLTSLFLSFIYISIVFIVFPLAAITLNTNLNLLQITNSLTQILGLIIFSSGIVMILYCILLFFKIGKGTPVPIEPPKEFVTSGLYKHSRNPIYIGDTLIFLGISLIFGHLLLYIYTLLAFMFYYLFIVLYEEPSLRRRFGSSYTEYCKKTPRWLKV